MLERLGITRNAHRRTGAGLEADQVGLFAEVAGQAFAEHFQSFPHPRDNEWGHDLVEPRGLETRFVTGLGQVGRAESMADAVRIGDPRFKRESREELTGRYYEIGRMVDGLVPRGHPSTPGFNDPAYPIEGRPTWSAAAA